MAKAKTKTQKLSLSFNIFISNIVFILTLSSYLLGSENRMRSVFDSKRFNWFSNYIRPTLLEFKHDIKCRT